MSFYQNVANRTQKTRKLTMGQASEIRRRHMAGESTASLSKEFKIGVSTVYGIVNGRTYVSGGV